MKITHQARIGGSNGMSYGLKCQGQVLRLVVSPRANSGDPDEWFVEARAKRISGDEVVAAEWGPTRIDALRAAGRRWDADRMQHGLMMFDWDAVAKALGEVRAV